jgi:hypothetical protein
MLDTELFRNVLKLPEPWQVEEVRVDKPSNRIDIRIDLIRRKSSFFSKQVTCPRCHRPMPEPTGQERVLRHLNIGEMRAYLTVPVVRSESANQNDCGCRRAWSKPGSRFTVEMERLIVEGLHLLRSIDAVSKLYGVNAADVRDVNAQQNIISFDKTAAPAQAPAVAYAQAHFDDGGLEVAYIDHDDVEETTAPIAQPIVAAAPSAAGTTIPAAIPPESDPLWQRIIDNPGQTAVETLGLKMLLEQIRLSLASNSSASARLAGARILRLYFIKHWRHSKDELSRLLDQNRTGIGTAGLTAPVVDIPAENDPGWQYLIAGRVPIRGDAVALKMLIERLRLTLGARPTVASRLAGARILREFFLKHHARHRSELTQLVAAGRAHMRQATVPPPKADNTAAVEVPSDTARCWQLLIDGQLDIQASAVGLTMLLERVRLTIGRTPSPAARLAAARVLRQYFEKYKSRLEPELRLLAAEEVLVHAGTSAGQVVEFVEVPPESHPSWDKLIRGELQIRTEALGLKMLLERVRLSLGAEPTEALRLAAARVLRQYFIKHRSRHRAELEQLKAA